MNMLNSEINAETRRKAALLLEVPEEDVRTENRRLEEEILCLWEEVAALKSQLGLPTSDEPLDSPAVPV